MSTFLSPVCPIRLNEIDQDFVASDQMFCCYLVYFCSCIVTLRDCLPFSVHKMEIGKKQKIQVGGCSYISLCQPHFSVSLLHFVHHLLCNNHAIKSSVSLSLLLDSTTTNLVISQICALACKSGQKQALVELPTTN